MDTLIRAIKNFQPIDHMVYPVEQQDRRMISVYLHDNTGQKLMDQIQHALENEKGWRVVLSRIEATLPRIDETPEEKRSVQRSAIREEIYTDVSGGARLNTDYLVLVTLSTIVAAIGMNANGVAAGAVGGGDCLSRPWADNQHRIAFLQREDTNHGREKDTGGRRRSAEFHRSD